MCWGRGGVVTALTSRASCSCRYEYETSTLATALVQPAAPPAADDEDGGGPAPGDSSPPPPDPAAAAAGSAVGAPAAGAVGRAPPGVQVISTAAPSVGSSASVRRSPRHSATLSPPSAAACHTLPAAAAARLEPTTSNTGTTYHSPAQMSSVNFVASSTAFAQMPKRLLPGLVTVWLGEWLRTWSTRAQSSSAV